MEQAKLLHEIGMTDFVVVEMAEYLDTHPHDQEAIEYFNYYAGLKNRMMAEYAEKYYPLTLATANNSGKEWEWGLQNPPWQGGY
ncbi:MAG: spore coat protein CotJB [Lachnospiraceae bacterium]